MQLIRLAHSGAITDGIFADTAADSLDLPRWGKIARNISWVKLVPTW